MRVRPETAMPVFPDRPGTSALVSLTPGSHYQRSSPTETTLKWCCSGCPGHQDWDPDWKTHLSGGTSSEELTASRFTGQSPSACILTPLKLQGLPEGDRGTLAGADGGRCLQKLGKQSSFHRDCPLPSEPVLPQMEILLQTPGLKCHRMQPCLYPCRYIWL